jgi:hypothetical protein
MEIGLEEKYFVEILSYNIMQIVDQKTLRDLPADGIFSKFCDRLWVG